MFIFFFQAEDGIRDTSVTGVRTCALPIFWIEREGTYALALDHHKRPCEVVASNAGHLLFCGVPYAGRARLLGSRLLRADLFSGWGIRTLASGQPRYNPMSYRNGSSRPPHHAP